MSNNNKSEGNAKRGKAQNKERKKYHKGYQQVSGKRRGSVYRTDLVNWECLPTAAKNLYILGIQFDPNLIFNISK